MTDPTALAQADTEALAKELAIRLAVSGIKGLQAQHLTRTGTDWEAVEVEAVIIIRNLLIGLGCEAVVDAWNEVA